MEFRFGGNDKKTIPGNDIEEHEYLYCQTLVVNGSHAAGHNADGLCH